MSILTNTSPLPQLGLVCITVSEAVRYRALTRKRLLQFTPEEQRETLTKLYSDKRARLEAALDFCTQQNIKLYRLTSALFPFADTPLGEEVLTELSEAVRLTGQRALLLGVRIVLHPDQYCVLSSDSPAVIENSIKILSMHAWIMDLLQQPRSSWALMNIHGGKSDRAARLVSVIRDLPEGIRSRIVLENDEHAYGSREILEVCQAAGVPMVFDAHHHVCREVIGNYNDSSIWEFVAAARATWSVPEWQLVHISNGREYFIDPRHSDLITDMPDAYWDTPWIEVEAKHKELAIAKLREEWLSAPPAAGERLITVAT